MNFNFSQMCNIGVNCSMGKYILFLNDDLIIKIGKQGLYRDSRGSCTYLIYSS